MLTVVSAGEEWMMIRICAYCCECSSDREDGEGSGFMLTVVRAIQTGEDGECAGSMSLLGVQFGWRRMT